MHRPRTRQRVYFSLKNSKCLGSKLKISRRHSRNNAVLMIVYYATKHTWPGIGKNMRQPAHLETISLRIEVVPRLYLAQNARIFFDKSSDCRKCRLVSVNRQTQLMPSIDTAVPHWPVGEQV